MKILITIFSLLLYSNISIAGELDNITWITEEYPPYNYVDNGETKVSDQPTPSKICSINPLP